MRWRDKGRHSGVHFFTGAGVAVHGARPVALATLERQHCRATGPYRIWPAWPTFFSLSHSPSPFHLTPGRRRHPATSAAHAVSARAVGELSGCSCYPLSPSPFVRQGSGARESRPAPRFLGALPRWRHWQGFPQCGPRPPCSVDSSTPPG
jgi:hypothetical protein